VLGPRLRRGVELEEVGRGAFLLADSVTGRSQPVDEVQLELVHALDGERDAAALAEELLGDAQAAGTVSAFLDKLERLGFVGRDGEDPAALDRRQREALLVETRARRDARVSKMIGWAATSIPFHRARFAGTDVRGFADLPRLPVMGKKDVREHFPAGLLPDGLDIDALVSRGEASLEATSGTADDRLQVFFDHSRPGFHLGFPGVRPIEGGWGGARIAVFTTPICSGTVCHLGGMPFDERLKGELTLNSSDRVMRLQRAELDGILEDWERFRPTVLRCDPVYATALVRALEREKLPVPLVAAVWTTFEWCSVIHRAILGQAFGAPVFEYYGGTDVGGSETAFRCEKGRYHVWEDSYAVEVARGGAPVAVGELGDVLVTSLRNRVMPMVRYRIGDLARPLADDCRCAHDYWSSFQLEGRIKDCLSDGEGRPVTTRDVDELFRGLGWVDFYQLAQAGPGDYQLLAVRRAEHARAGVAPGADDERIFRERALALLGEGARLAIRYVREIPPEKSLKYRLTAPATSGWQG